MASLKSFSEKLDKEIELSQWGLWVGFIFPQLSEQPCRWLREKMSGQEMLLDPVSSPIPVELSSRTFSSGKVAASIVWDPSSFS